MNASVRNDNFCLTRIFFIYDTRKTVCESYVFTGVKSVHRGGVSTSLHAGIHLLGQTLPRKTLPCAVHAGKYGQCAGGTHLTGIHCCSICSFIFSEFPFDFVFLVPLRNVTKNSSLAEIIIAEHEQLEAEDTDTINAILKGKTNHKVLLLLDGYDEYTPGTNEHVDKAIKSTVGKCFLLLTSRPKPDESRKEFLAKQIRNKMDGEVVIEGFSEENIRKCSVQYLGNEEKADKMFQEAKDKQVYPLLNVPILLFMVCVLYNENGFLPKTRTKLFHTIYKLIVDRSTMKTFGCKADDLEQLESMLFTLGQFAWEALQNDVGQLLLNRVNISDLDFIRSISTY